MRQSSNIMVRTTPDDALRVSLDRVSNSNMTESRGTSGATRDVCSDRAVLLKTAQNPTQSDATVAIARSIKETSAQIVGGVRGDRASTAVCPKSRRKKWVIVRWGSSTRADSYSSGVNSSPAKGNPRTCPAAAAWATEDNTCFVGG